MVRLIFFHSANHLTSLQESNITTEKELRRRGEEKEKKGKDGENKKRKNLQ
jgi:hypothetical protein